MLDWKSSNAQERINIRAYAEFRFAQDSLFGKVQQKVKIQHKKNWLILCNG